MRAWALVDLTSVPNIFSEGLTNPSAKEIIFHATPDIIADEVISAREDEDIGEDYLPAFIQVDFHDEDLDYWFDPCYGSNYDLLNDDESSLQARWESGDITDEEYNAEREQLELIRSALDNHDIPVIFDTMDFACLAAVVPPDMIMLLDPNTMLEAVLTHDEAAIIEAMGTAEVKSFKTLGSEFWVWLIMFMAGLFGPNWSEQAEIQEAAEKAEERRERRKGRRKTKKKPKRKKAKKPRKRKKALSGVFA